ncbi:MAG: DNA cytosine methyltransferase [Verrucomicrobiota bacterium]
MGRNGQSARLWIESQRLESLGFGPGVPLAIDSKTESLVLRPAVLAENHVSSRIVPGGRRPIIDLANQSLLAPLTPYSQLKIIASFERIEVSPSRRAFAIHQSRSLQPPFRVLELFAGGGTMTVALGKNSVFQLVAGVEIEPNFADEWQARHADAILVQADIRALQTKDFPDFDILIGGIPCTCHSNMGRAKKGLAGRPELGDSGDLFLPAVNLISERMPVAVVLENVPAFANSLAGELVTTNLSRIGYHVFTTILQPNAEWGEIEDRKRWLLIATLDKPFALQIPNQHCKQALRDFLDEPDEERDRCDAARIQKTIAGLRVHNARHREAGHGFGFTVVNGETIRLPTIPKSYHKINTGPFVETVFGPRLLRQEEIERIHGCQVGTKHYATAVQILGQGVQTNLFRKIFEQLGHHLKKGDC